MPLIKNIRAKELVNNAVVMNLGDVRARPTPCWSRSTRCVAVVAEARAEADRLVAERPAPRAGGRGEPEGRAAGIEAGTLEAPRRPRPRPRNASRRSGTAGRRRCRRSSAREDRASRPDDLLRLSLAIAERVLGRQPMCDPTVVVEQLEAAMQMLIKAIAA